MFPLWSLLLGVPVLLSGPRHAGPEKLALVVGIDHYEHPGADGAWKDLHGAVGDAGRVRDLLVGRFGFPAGNVLVLTDGQATHAGIVRAFHDHLILQAGPETEVVFWYSGHGSRIPDGSGKEGVELDGLDSTLVAYDSRRDGAEGSFDITDDELQSLLRALCARTSRVTVVTDACHSGGVTRGPGATTPRAAPAGERPIRFDDLKDFWPRDVVFLEDGDPRRAEPLPYLHIAACSTLEKADEIPIQEPDGAWRSFGALTWFLTAALERMQPGTSYERLVREVAVRLGDRFPGQDVQLRGPGNRAVFGAGFTPPLPGFEALLQPGLKAFTVQAGSLHLLRRGSILEVQDLYGKGLGRARLTRIWSDRSTAVWEGEPPEIAGKRPVRVVEVERPPGDEPLALFLPEGGLEDRLAKGLAGLPGLSLRFEREPGGGAAYQLFRPAEDAPFELWTVPGGLPLWREKTRGEGSDGAARAEGMKEELASFLRQELRFRALLALGEQQGGLPLAFDFESPEPKALEQWSRTLEKPLVPVEMVPNTSRGIGGPSSSGMLLVDRGGDDLLDVAEIRLHMEKGPGTRPMHVAVLCVSEDRTVSVIYPPPGERDNVLAPGETKSIYLSIFAGKHWREKRPMRDRYLAIATERYADFGSFVRDGVVVPPESARGAAEPLPPLLEQALTGGTTRGGMILRKSERGFGIAALDVFVVPESP